MCSASACWFRIRHGIYRAFQKMAHGPNMAQSTFLWPPSYAVHIGCSIVLAPQGTAIAFVNEKCPNLHDLYDILVEAGLTLHRGPCGTGGRGYCAGHYGVTGVPYLHDVYTACRKRVGDTEVFCQGHARGTCLVASP